MIAPNNFDGSFQNTSPLAVSISPFEVGAT